MNTKYLINLFTQYICIHIYIYTKKCVKEKIKQINILKNITTHVFFTKYVKNNII